MKDGERKQKAARDAPDALALPHVVETIAMCLKNQNDFMSFLHAIPCSGRTPALTAFLDCTTVMSPSVIAIWPSIVLTRNDVPPSVLALLAATLPLRPRIDLHCFGDASPLVSLVAILGPALSSVRLESYCNSAVNAAISDLLLQRCPRLHQVSISAASTEIVELNDLLAVVAHPHIHALDINLQHATTAPRLGYHLAAWLSTAPAAKLRLVHVAQMDHDGAIAFCDALQANTTLRVLTINNVRSLGGFHGRTLPVSLKSLTWDARFIRAVNVATLTDLATAVGPTQLERLECSVFGQLATYLAAAPMLAHLQCLIVSGLNANHMLALIAGLSSVPALTSLELRDCDLSSPMQLMETLGTTCMHLETLSARSLDMTRNGIAAVLSGVLRLPRLISLSLLMRLPDVLYVLPELVAAGRQLYYLNLTTIGRDNGDLEKRAICKALAQVYDVPFVLQRMPEDMDKFVVDALSQRAWLRQRCDLYF